MSARRRLLRTALPAALAASLLAAPAARPAAETAAAASPFIGTVYPVPSPRGLMVTSGGVIYCGQVRALAQRTGYTLLCGRYAKDGYLDPTLRARRHLDWGNPGYLAGFAREVSSLHRRVGGSLVLIGVSYSGFGVATLAAHHPEIRPDRLIVIDSYFDLVARRRELPPTHETAREIDLETGGSVAALQARSASPAGLARLVRDGTRLTVIWSVSAAERREFHGATCNVQANAGVLSQVARLLGRPLTVWVTTNRHGQDLWVHGRAIMEGRNPGRPYVLGPDGSIPAGSVCKPFPPPA